MKAIFCELCELWYHTKCEDVDDAQYAALEADSLKDDLVLHWFCHHCNRSAVKILSNLVKMQKKIDNLQDEVISSTSRLSDIEEGKFTEKMKEN